jgi:type I restriction enzyme S subunit
MNTWQTVKLGDVLQEVDLRFKDFDENEKNNISVLSLTKDHGLILQSERFLKQVATDDLTKYKVVRNGWIAYNPYVIWEGAIHALTDKPFGLVSPAYVVWKTKNGEDINFMSHLLKSPILLNKYLMVANGTVKRRRAVKKTSFENIEISLPPIEEQNAIGNLLNTIQESIKARLDELNLEREHKELLLTHIIHNGLTDNKTAHAKLGDIPSNWDVVKLGDTLKKTQYGLSIKGSTSGKYPYLRMNSLSDGYVTNKNLQFVNVDESILATYKLNEGDLLFNRTNSIELVGKTGLFNLSGDYVFASYLVRLIANREKIIPEYLNAYINWSETQKRLKSIATKGVGQSNINATKLSNLYMHLPPISEQKKIVELLVAFDNKLRALENEITLLKELFSSVLDELIERKLNIRLLIN